MKNYKKRLFFLCAGCLLLLFLLNKITWKEERVEVPVAAITIEPRTKITSDMIHMKEIPKTMLHDSIYSYSEEIIDKYNDIEGKIPADSFFYKEMLAYEDELPDQPALKLKDGQVSYSLEADLIKSSGNSFVPGQKVDIYVSIADKMQIPKVDCLIQNARILDIRDRNGYALNDEKSSHIPGVILLAIYNDQINYVKVAEKLGDISLMASSSSYDLKKESVLKEDSDILKYLR